jgi:hypothetical protein
MKWLEWATRETRAKPRLCGHGGTNKDCAVIRVDGESTGPVLELLIGELRSAQKRRNAEVVLEYLKGRKERLLIRDHLGRIQRAGYTRAEIELIGSIRNHAKAKSSEAICQAPNVIG